VQQHVAGAGGHGHQAGVVEARGDDFLLRQVELVRAPGAARRQPFSGLLLARMRARAAHWF